VDARQTAIVLKEAAASIPELAQAAGVAQLIAAQGIGGASVRFVLDEHSPFTELSVDMAEGAEASLYPMVRTAPLDASLFRAVPAEAVAVSAAAFGPADLAGLSSIAGQADLSFMDDLDQYVLFVLPFDQAYLPDAELPMAIVTRVGLAMSVKEGVDPAMLLEPIAAVPQGMAAMIGRTIKPVRRDGETVVMPLPDGVPVPELRLAAAGDCIVLSAGPEALDASLESLAGGPSALDEGPLREALARLEP
jgi:hypothetical protein